MLRDRFPKVGALFLAGELNARRVWLSSDRTHLVTDAEALAELDSVIAERLTTWGPLSEYTLAQAIDVWVDKIDPGALCRTRNKARTRDFTVADADADADGTAAVFGRLLATDAALMKHRLAAMARGVCQDDPRTLGQRRADAVGAAAAGDEGRASSVVVHVVTEQATTEAEPDPLLNGDGLTPPEAPEPATRRKAAMIVGGGPVPAPPLAELIARGAKVKLVGNPGHEPEPQYRPSTALDEFVRMRDMTCRGPGCDRPAVFGDIDHTVAYPGGPTHPGNLKCYCRKHRVHKRLRQAT